MIPSRLADFHSEGAGAVIATALSNAGISPSDIDAVGYTKGPGLGASLRIGFLSAYALSRKINVPLIPVNHGIAHIEIAKRLNRMNDPVALYVSGGNSQILKMVEKPYRHYNVYGETYDIGVGNMLDSFARGAGLNPAWGSSVAESSSGGKYIELPYTVKGMDFTFTGLMTNALAKLRSEPLKDVCYSIQETAFSMLCEATERTLLLTGSKELVVCGGVAQSGRLKEMAQMMARPHRIKVGTVADEYNADNGAMIGVVAERIFLSGSKHGRGIGIDQRYRLDSVKVTWT
jgi:glycoprotease/Kae1 family metallohydrolase